jgi:hypothetical protein|tara:strand:+ start:698 stop:877 length:180 start_codon:yes stop_codon:yes gene_type:complete
MDEQKICSGAKDILAHLKHTDYSPQEKIAMCKSAVEVISHVLVAEVIVITFHNALNKKD